MGATRTFDKIKAIQSPRYLLCDYTIVYAIYSSLRLRDISGLGKFKDFFLHYNKTKAKSTKVELRKKLNLFKYAQ